jgi:hypothetical protein
MQSRGRERWTEPSYAAKTMNNFRATEVQMVTAKQIFKFMEEFGKPATAGFRQFPRRNDEKPAAPFLTSMGEHNKETGTSSGFTYDYHESKRNETRRDSDAQERRSQGWKAQDECA